ncbi:hypothetical protein LSAT2_025154 [Lamellibrachia satsuma]|nr:hypothetical protein LSAT2_025154 [Lamellibrachia satsuma]
MTCPVDRSQMCGGRSLMNIYDVELLVVHGLAVDTATGKIYFTNNNKVEVVNKNSKERARVIKHSSGVRTYGVALDSANSLLVDVVSLYLTVLVSEVMGVLNARITTEVILSKSTLLVGSIILTFKKEYCTTHSRDNATLTVFTYSEWTGRTLRQLERRELRC